MEEITPEEMAVEERRAVSLGISLETLMENAGSRVAQSIESRFGPASGKKVVVVAGNGNNGGDGFVAARHLGRHGAAVRVLLLSDSSAIKTAEARKNWDRLRGTNVEVVEAVTEIELRRRRREIRDADFVIDALLGTGAKGEIREPYATAIRLINESSGKKIAVDVPTGLDPLTGETREPTVKADLTVTFHRAKVGLRGKEEYTGEIVVAPIGIPRT